MEEMYSLIGQYQASLENAKEEAIRDAMTAVVEEDPEYQQALAEGNGAKMGELLGGCKGQSGNRIYPDQGISAVPFFPAGDDREFADGAVGVV